jgi:hypothetical protein
LKSYTMPLNQELVKLARYRLHKTAFQPPMDPSQQQGGQPPMDPSMGGGAPPGMDPSQGGGMPPGMDPSMMQQQQQPPPGMDPSMGGGGGMPPQDPSMGGGQPVPGAGGLTSDSIRQIMQEVLGQLGVVPGQAGPGGGAAGGKPGKPDLMAMSMDIFQLKKMVSSIMNTMDIPMPQEIIDGPNRDPGTGVPMPPGSPGSTSDPSRASQPMGGGGGGGGAGGGAGGDQPGAIKPISPMQGALPTQKSGEHIGESVQPQFNTDVRNKAAALNAILRRKLGL